MKNTIYTFGIYDNPIHDSRAPRDGPRYLSRFVAAAAFDEQEVVEPG